MKPETSGFQSSSAEQIDMVSRLRLHEPAIAWFYEDFVTRGVLEKEAAIVDTFPKQLRVPIIHTLGTHVTKEKPQFVFHLGTVANYLQDQTTSLAAVTDLLWSFALIYDDIHDHDEKRGGKQTAWKEFGTDVAMKSIESGYANVLQFVAHNFSPSRAEECKEYIEIGINSLSKHKQLSVDSPLPLIEKNYIDRARFHTDFPIAALFPNSIQKDNAMQALQQINFAGQILNDVKDLLPENVSGRPNFSDIRERVVTIPIKYLWEEGTSEEKNLIAQLMSGDVPLGQSQKDAIEQVIRNHSIPCLIKDQLIQLYASSLQILQETTNDPTTLQVFQTWNGYKLKQVNQLLSSIT